MERRENEQHNHNEILKRLDDMELAQGKRFKAIEDKIEPMYEMFSSVSGFNRISIWILKFLAMVGAAIVGTYALIEFLKKLGK